MAFTLWSMLHETTSNLASKTPRARRRDANLSRILEAAMELVAEGGLEALSMGRLAEAVDYTPGALYRYFPSKDALLAGLLAQVLDELQVFLVQSAEVVNPLARVFTLAHAYRRFARERPHAFGFLSSTIAEPRILVGGADANPVAERSIALLELVATALGDAASQKLIDDEPGTPLERTLTLFATLQGLLQLQKQSRFESALVDLGPLVTHAVRTLLIGWGGKARGVDAASSIAGTGGKS
ncbi:MAG: TetR/AcrR family transcriptional regulator [Archangium sp.]|nr:TetR/AcrR family transcriptional regulator [Archangium sp.]